MSLPEDEVVDTVIPKRIVLILIKALNAVHIPINSRLLNGTLDNMCRASSLRDAIVRLFVGRFHYYC
jgi:hypothetical protein